MRKRVERRKKAHSRRKESTLNFWLWRGHGFEKYNIKAFFLPSIFLSSLSAHSCAALCTLLISFVFCSLACYAVVSYSLCAAWLALAGFDDVCSAFVYGDAIGVSINFVWVSFLHPHTQPDPFQFHFYDQGNFMWSSRPLILKSSNYSRGMELSSSARFEWWQLKFFYAGRPSLRTLLLEIIAKLRILHALMSTRCAQAVTHASVPRRCLAHFFFFFGCGVSEQPWVGGGRVALGKRTNH